MKTIYKEFADIKYSKQLRRLFHGSNHLFIKTLKSKEIKLIPTDKFYDQKNEGFITCLPAISLEAALAVIPKTLYQQKLNIKGYFGKKILYDLNIRFSLDYKFIKVQYIDSFGNIIICFKDNNLINALCRMIEYLDIWGLLHLNQNNP